MLQKFIAGNDKPDPDSAVVTGSESLGRMHDLGDNRRFPSPGSKLKKLGAYWARCLKKRLGHVIQPHGLAFGVEIDFALEPVAELAY